MGHYTAQGISKGGGGGGGGGAGGGLTAGRVRNEWPSFTLPKPHLNVFRFKLSNSYKIEGCYSFSGERRS